MTRQRIILAAVAALAAGGVSAYLLAGTGTSYQPKSLPVAAPSVTSPAPSQAASPGVAAATRSNPVRLVIPSIGVNTAILPPAACCGVLAGGALQTPPLTGAQADEAGWWYGGFAPGQDGPAVLVGHINSAALGNLVFANLGRLQAGDTAEVDLADGAKVTFTVTAKQEVSKTTGPFWTGFWHSATQPGGAPALRLITCGGAFNSGTGHYDDNLIVYATEVAS